MNKAVDAPENLNTVGERAIEDHASHTIRWICRTAASLSLRCRFPPSPAPSSRSPDAVFGFQQQWELTQVRIILLEGLNLGWLQSVKQDDGLFLGQLFVDGPFQRRSIGTEVINRLIGEAARVISER